MWMSGHKTDRTDEEERDTGTGEDEDFEDFIDEDLIQENNMLRDQIAAIYSQIAETQKEAEMAYAYRQAECQTDEEMVFSIEAVQVRLATLENSLVEQKARIKISASEASEGLRRINSKEQKILSLNQKLVTLAPVKARVYEMTASNDLLQVSRCLWVMGQSESMKA
jgi:hypothetical protein